MPFTKTNSVNTYYEVHGEGQGLVFIHGLASSHEAWEPQVKAFSKEFRVITYDLRGHGRTKGSGKTYSIATFVKDLYALLKKLEVHSPIICGLSLGGIIAQRYAVKHSVHSLILSDTFHSGKIIALLQHLPQEIIESIAGILPKGVLVNIGFLMLAPPNTRIRNKVKKWVSQISETELKKSLMAAYDFEKVDLSKIGVPTLILVGENENPFVKSDSKKLHGGIRGSHKVIINDATHISNLENPKQFNWIMRSFLAEHLE
jgi:pimeloyl-ACP methyl ester carboxylesterase